MASSLLRRWTAWLCMAVALLTGVTPAQGFVLCFEPDGDVCVELVSTSPTCGGCTDSRAASESGLAHADAPPSGCCACLDLDLPGSAQDRCVHPKAIHFDAAPLLVSIPAPPSPIAPFATVAACARRHVTEPPRPPEVLGLVRCVVLQV